MTVRTARWWMVDGGWWMVDGAARCSYPEAMGAVLRVRQAVAADAPRLSEIGAAAMRVQYAGLVDPVAVDSAIAQTYSHGAIAHCIELCSQTPSAEFLVAERHHDVVGYLHFDCIGPEPELRRRRGHHPDHLERRGSLNHGQRRWRGTTRPSARRALQRSGPRRPGEPHRRPRRFTHDCLHPGAGTNST